MRLKILLILSFSILVVYAQDDKTKNPNVELPDFVITGKSQLNIKKVDKIKPDFISSVNEDFINQFIHLKNLRSVIFLIR